MKSPAAKVLLVLAVLLGALVFLVSRAGGPEPSRATASSDLPQDAAAAFSPDEATPPPAGGSPSGGASSPLPLAGGPPNFPGEATPPDLAAPPLPAPSSKMDKRGAAAGEGEGRLWPEPVAVGRPGFERLYNLALDEVWIRPPGEAGRLVKVATAAPAELDALLAGYDNGTAMAVLYEHGAPRGEATRRTLSTFVTAKLAAGAAPSDVARRAGALSFEQPPYAPEFVVLQAPGGLASLELARKATMLEGVEYAEAQVAAFPARHQAALPNDPYVGQQWHLRYANQPGAVAGTDINVTSVWNYPAGPGWRGRGITIGIVDDGVQLDHPDLAANADPALSYDYVDNDANANPSLVSDNHGTAVAGDAAAVGNNGIGVSGSAPEARLASLRLIVGAPLTDKQIADALAHQVQAIHIKNNSWGYVNPFVQPQSLTSAALRHSALNGRGGLGSIFLFAAGNSGEAGDNANYDSLAASIYTIAVGAFDSQGRQSWYSEPGANLLISGPSNGRAPALGKTTTDRTGAAGYNSGSTAGEMSDADYTQRFGGTSSATPTVAGVVALMLEANPRLGWRDVQEILLRSARQVNPSDPDWVTNPAGIRHNHKYGAGLVDAAAAVALGANWQPLGPALERVAQRDNLNLPLPDNNPSGVSVDLVIPNATNARVEQVTLEVDVSHSYRGDLRIILRSPSGVESVLAAPNIRFGGRDLRWVFSSVRHWGEDAAGTWTVRVSDELVSDLGQLNAVKLSIHGTYAPPANPPPTVELLVPAPGSRTRLTPGESIRLEAQASDVNSDGLPTPVDVLEFLVDGQPLAGVVTPGGAGQASRLSLDWTPPLGDYEIRARAIDREGKEGISTAAILRVRFAPAGSLRETFVPPSLDNTVQALAADADGRVYIGGMFTAVGGSAAPRLARLRPDGSRDLQFSVGTGPDSQVRSLVWREAGPERGLYVGGAFASFAGHSHRALVRLNIGRPGFVDGSVDTNFQPRLEGSGVSAPSVRALAVQDDGKILVGGSFARVGGVARLNVARLHADGSLDEGFRPDPNGAVHAIAVQPDGKIVLGGSFSSVGASSRQRIVRLDRDGRVDGSFVTGDLSTGGFDGPVNTLALLSDGSIVAGGSFSRYHGRVGQHNLAKLSAGGALDGRFNAAPGLNNIVNDVHVRPGDRMIVSGLFNEVGNDVLRVPRTLVGGIFQIDARGLLDADFNPDESGANGSVLDSLPLANGDVLLAGSFTRFNGQPRERLAVVAGYEAPAPLITSAWSRAIDAGGDLAFQFTAVGAGPLEYELRAGVLPRGVKFNRFTGLLEGIPLDPGQYKVSVVARSADGRESVPTTFSRLVNEAKVSFAQWKRAWFPAADWNNADVSGPAAVSNPQGLANYAVYALSGGDPTVSDPWLVPQMRRERIGAWEYLTLTAPKYPGALVKYRVEYSPDLQTWLSEAEGGTLTLEDSATQIRARAAIPMSGSARQFLRLKIMANDAY